MGKDYDQLTASERCEIARLRQAGQSIRQIATALDRSPSSISRELNRNHGAQVGYQPVYAQEQAAARRWKGSRLERDAKLRRLVLGCLRRGWSPEQIAGWLDRQKVVPTVSHETIYRFIYAQIRRTNDGSWRNYLPRAKYKRGWRAKSGGSPASFIKDRVSIALRPRAVQARRTFGHWEADLMLFATTGPVVLVAHERKSRLLLLAKQPSKASQPAAEQLIAWFEALDRRLRKTITFDNGTEFAQHFMLTDELKMRTFFCDPHSPWQKGSIENAIGRMRRPLPRKTDLTTIADHDLDAYVAAYNNTPRRCLGFKSPAQAFLTQLLHFKCESTPSLRSG
jgi:transposase, IS30 family